MKYIKLLIIFLLFFCIISCSSGNSSNNSSQPINEKASAKVFAYVANSISGTIDTFLLDQVTGNLVKLNLTESLRPLSNYLLYKNKYLPYIFIYELSSQSRIVYTYKHNESSGKLLFQNQTIIESSFNGMSFLSYDGKFLYVNKDNILAKYNIESSTGAITLASESIVDLGSKLLYMTYNPKNNNYYVLTKDINDNYIIKVFSYNALNGNLTNNASLTYSFIESYNSLLPDPAMLNFDKDNQYLVAAFGMNINSISRLYNLKVEANSGLTTMSQESVAKGLLSFNISDSNYVYIQFMDSVSMQMIVSVYKIQANGVLTKISNSDFVMNDIMQLPGVFSPNYLYYYILPNSHSSGNTINQYKLGNSGILIPLSESVAYSSSGASVLLFVE